MGEKLDGISVQFLKMKNWTEKLVELQQVRFDVHICSHIQGYTHTASSSTWTASAPAWPYLVPGCTKGQNDLTGDVIWPYLGPGWHNVENDLLQASLAISGNFLRLGNENYQAAKKSKKKIPKQKKAPKISGTREPWSMQACAQKALKSRSAKRNV